MSNQLYIVMYHYTRDLGNSRYPGIKGLDTKLFVQQLDFFEKFFHVVKMEDVIAAWNGENNLPDHALLLTFDDGYIDNYLTAYPLLKERGMQGSFFIPGRTFTENVLLDVNKVHFVLASAGDHNLADELKRRMNYYRGKEFDFPSTEELYQKYAVPNRFDSADTIFLKRMLQTVLPERLRFIIASELFEKYVGIPEDKFARELYMNRNQIRHMKNDGMFIGLHGYDHYWMADLKEDELHRDITKMLEVMGEFIDRDCWVLNYPYGNYSDSVIQYVESKGCKLGMTTEVRCADVDRDNRFTLPRLDCNDFPPKSEKWREIENE